MQRSSLFNAPPTSVGGDYSFCNQELDYALFRPQWPVSFANAALQKADIRYDAGAGVWMGLAGNPVPIIVIVGSGAGADAKPFLELGCKVYAIEPNAELRRLACEKFAATYPNFISVNGNAHELNLPPGTTADLIVCAQALHTFSNVISGNHASEGTARECWRRILPDDNRNRLSIWYYNLDAGLAAIIDLHASLQAASATYAKSKTAFLDAPMLEPDKFQQYISIDAMQVSTAQLVDMIKLNLESAGRWLRSFSFYPKDSAEKERVIKALSEWFDRHKDLTGHVHLAFMGYITQGPLRVTPYFATAQSLTCLASPITLAARQDRQDLVGDFWPLTINEANHTYARLLRPS